MAVKITSREELEAWLEDKPREWAQVIALRSALRALPLVAVQRPVASEAVNRELALLVFRAFLISFCATKLQPDNLFQNAKFAAGAVFIKANHAFHLQQSNEWKVADSHGENEKARWQIFVDRSSTVTAAWEAAANVVSSAVASSNSDAANASQKLVTSLQATNPVPHEARPFFFRAILKDCEAFQSGNSPTSMEGRRLWTDAPVYWNHAWEKARRWLSLPDYGFQIWREWYYGRIEGLPHAFADFDDEADEKFYRWMVEQDDDWWSREPAEVNAEITEFVDALRNSDLPTDEELQQNPRAFTFSLDEQGRSTLDEDTLPNGLQGDADERDNHGEILRLIEAALLATAGDTNAKAIAEPTELLKDAVGQSVEELRPRLFVLRARCHPLGG